MFLRVFGLGLLALCLSACAGGGSDKTSVFKDAIDYASISSFDTGCQEEKVRKVKYFQCKDSRALYEAAFDKAKAQGKPLMVTFGFNTCPYCLKLDKEIYDTENPVTGDRVKQYLSREAAAALGELEVLTLRLHARSEHGLRLADELGVTQMAQSRGWHRVWSPFVVFVNPQSGAMASESLWEAETVYCDWAANIAVSLEKNGTVKRGRPQAPRKRCPK
jgi:hypothetical protein